MLRSAASPHIAPTDAELLHRFLQTRDDEAFGRLVARHGEPVRRVAVRATGNPSAAEDVAQAAFIVLSRRPRAAWVSACCRGSTLPWLVRTTRYAASSWRRTESRRRKHESAAARSERIDPSEPGALTEAVAAALSYMPRSERRLITLRHLDEKPWPDIAHQLGVTPEAARKSAARALVRLRERLRHQGIVVTPAALAIALATLSRPAHAAAVAGSSSAFLIARGVLTMMKIKTAGLAGTALLVGVTSVGALSVGAGGASSAVPSNKAQSFTTGTLESNGASFSDLSDPQASNEQDDRPEAFKANEHQPTVTLADGTALTLLAISNGEDGWWHANGARARAPRHYLPRGFGVSSMSLSSDNADSILDMVLFAEPAARADDNGDQKAGQAMELVRVLDDAKKSPESTGIGISSVDGRQSWRIMMFSDAESPGAFLCIATGEPQKVGEIKNVDGAWVADDGAQKWVTLGAADKKIFVEAGKPGEESSAISVVAVGDGGHHGHGYVEEQRMVFEEHALDGVQRLEVYRRPLQVVRLANLAPQPEQATRPRMELDDEPMVLMTGGHSITAATEADGHTRTTVQVGSDGHSHTHVETDGAQATTIQRGSGGTTTVTGRGAASTTSGGRGQGGAAAGGAGSGAGQDPKKPDGEPKR